MFQSVYDYPYLSSSANHIFDISCGYSADSHLSNSANTQNSKKINIYNQMAQVLYGFETDGTIKKFDADGNLADTTADKIKHAYFISFSRLLVKDEIQKGTFTMVLNAGSKYGRPQASGTLPRLTITDRSGSDGYLINSPVGEYGILYVTASQQQSDPLLNTINYYQAGLIFYQAGVCVLTASLFHTASGGGFLKNDRGNISMGPEGRIPFIGRTGTTGALAQTSISGNADNLRNKIESISFNNTVELNSTVYFCRINHNEFNYSSNPTYLSSSKINVKEYRTDPPVSYITSVGLYDSQDRLLAVGKLSEPLKKDPTVEYTLRARLDY